MIVSYKATNSNNYLFLTAAALRQQFPPYCRNMQTAIPAISSTTGTIEIPAIISG